MSVVEVNYDFWEQRFEILNQKMKGLHVALNEALPEDVSRLKDLKELTKCLRIYTNGEFEFFKDGFTRLDEKKLNSTNRYPPEHSFRSVIHQGYEDTKLYEHIFSQRSSMDQTVRKALEVVDKLAWDALQPAMAFEKCLIPKNTTILSYFDKIASVRIIPYAPVALIGVPFTALNEPIDLLAIPHEIGHYVFQRATKPAKDVDGNDYQRPLRNIIYRTISNERDPENRNKAFYPGYLQDWLEETFSDVYGCLIAGPIIALDFQDLQLDYAIKRFVMNDGDHPSPILRPYIYTKVLGDFSSQWADLLESFWDLRRIERELALPENERGKFRHQGKLMARVDSILPKGRNQNTGKLEKIIRFMLEELATINAPALRTAQWWTTYREQAFVNLGNDQEAIQNTLYKPFRDEFFDRGEDDKLTGWKANPALGLNALPNTNKPFHDFDEYDTVINQDNEIDKNVLISLLDEWPKAFFPGEPRPVQKNRRSEHIDDPDIDQDFWWVWDVLFRAGWNTFGNGDWLKGP